MCQQDLRQIFSGGNGPGGTPTFASGVAQPNPNAALATMPAPSDANQPPPQDSSAPGNSDSGGVYDPAQDPNRRRSSPLPVNSNAPRQMTKGQALLKFIAPILGGGLVGLAGGKGHPQGGFGAANEFFAQRRQSLLQQAMLQRQQQDDAFRNALEAAKTQRELARPNFTGRSTQPIAAVDSATGKSVYIQQNPQTGRMEPVPGYVPSVKEDKVVYDSERGLIIDPTKAPKISRTSSAAGWKFRFRISLIPFSLSATTTTFLTGPRTR